MFLIALKFTIRAVTAAIALLLITQHPGYAIKFSNYLIFLLLAYSLFRLFDYDKK
jgi:hypothetical protein